jgi:hypothetical protein
MRRDGRRRIDCSDSDDASSDYEDFERMTDVKQVTHLEI